VVIELNKLLKQYFLATLSQ